MGETPLPEESVNDPWPLDQMINNRHVLEYPFGN
jgi:hypothetical protein